ncbi:MAG: T9SS type A sorting domain-containing protein [Bacteroidales bacterium]|nr:T9SS type A sorting domain-containing protein [Bacteroidales bacterium]
MKKYSLLMLVAMFLFIGNVVKAQDEVEVLIDDDFEAYTVGNKLAQGAVAAGIDWWTTWSNAPGSDEDGVIVDLNGNKCAHLTEGNDQVLMLGGAQSGVYDLEFDILVPNGSHGYFNILHKFNGGNSKWAMQAYLHMTNDGQNSTYAPGHGTVHAGSNGTGDVAAIYDEWMHFRLHVDTDADLAQYYYSTPGNDEVKVCEWQWSLDSFGENTVGRELDAMDFFPPDAGSEYYLDNFKCTRIGGETAAELVFNPGEINETVAADDMASVTISIENEGTSIGDYSAWVDYGVGSANGPEEIISYAVDPVQNPSLITWTAEQAINFELAALYPATSYGNSVMGTYITGAMYAFFQWVDQTTQEPSPTFEPGTDIIFRIYEQGRNGNPGRVLAEKTISQNEIIWDQYTLVEFDEPVALTGYDVYVAVEMTAAVGGCIMNLDGSGQAVMGYGDLIRQNGGAYSSLNEDMGANNGNWCLAMLCEGTPVEGGYATLNKTYGSLPIGGSDEVTVNLSTIGLDAGETYEAAVKFVTNDPANPTVEIPLTLVVDGDNVNEVLSNTYNVYPNPTTGAVMVEGENIDYIAVYNSVGQLVNVVKNETNVVDMSSYENGVYFFNIVDNAGQESLQRVVVAK